ncbi:MAG: hypothetical protein ACRDHZ_00055 [Ktedonobacteraceae bacterium]
MQNHPDPTEHFRQFIKQSVNEYVDGLEEHGLKPNPIITQAWAERAVQEAQADYERQANSTLKHNIEYITHRHQANQRRIKHEGARLRLLTCPPIALFFGLIAVIFVSQGNWAMGMVYSIGSLAFLIMLLYNLVERK